MISFCLIAAGASLLEALYFKWKQVNRIKLWENNEGEVKGVPHQIKMTHVSSIPRGQCQLTYES